MQQILRMGAASMRPDASSGSWIGRALLSLLLALSSGYPIPAHAAAGGKFEAGEAPKRRAPRHVQGPSLEDRVKTLSQALDLDAKQQARLRKVLEGQREQVRRVWSDASVPAAYRVSATQAISDNTADQIRALLSEEQKKHYNPPKPPREALPGSSRPSVEAWMSPAKAR